MNPEHAYQVASLRLQLLVAMAASDDRLQTIEVERIADVIDDAKVDPDAQDRLQQLLRMLLDAPPDLEQLIARIVDQRPRRHVAEGLVSELVQIARIDDHLDEREEALLRMVCGALGLPPTSLHGGSPAPLDMHEQAQLDELLAAVTTAVA